MRAIVNWEDANGGTHRFQIDYDPDDAEARLFLQGIELHARFRLETFDADTDAGLAVSAGPGVDPAGQHSSA